jgi:hypothetical protein
MGRVFNVCFAASLVSFKVAGWRLQATHIALQPNESQDLAAGIGRFFNVCFAASLVSFKLIASL